MRVSLNTIKQYIDFELPPVDELVQRVNEQLGGVEEVIDLNDKYKDAVIVRVAECKKHPNADKLSVCMIDVGENSPYSKFYVPNSNHLVEVVCGAPNVREGMFVIWLPPGATVPASYNDKQPFVLDVRDIRGVKSHGMLAAADELGIGSDHSGIIELTDNDLSPHGSIEHLKPGLNFAKTFGLDDTVIDIENKMFTHRPDCFGQLGVAREIAGILGKQFTSPVWYELKREEGRGKREEVLPLKVTNEAGGMVPRYVVAVIRDVEIQPSPMWIQCGLVRLGVKPINNVVDATNALMITTAQPTHAYDYDKLRGAAIGTRFAKKGETLKLLNGKTYELDPADIVIVDGEGPIGLGGVMGGGNSEVSKTTKNLVLEVATFDMYTTRRSSMRHGIFTEAVSRFNKGQSPLQNIVVMNALIDAIKSSAGGKQASAVFDEHDVLHDRPVVRVSAKDIAGRLGIQLDGEKVASILRNVEIDLADNPKKPGEVLELAVPFWRTDIERLEDVVEEVGRLIGFDALPRELPLRSTRPTPLGIEQQLKRQLRDSLRRAGCNEVLTYSFVNEKVIKKANQDVKEAFKLSNALSPDLQYYRLSVLPSLLDAVHANVKSGYDEFVLYEIGKGHNKKDPVADDGLPSELKFVDAVYASKKPRDGAALYHMRATLDALAADLGLDLVYNKVGIMKEYSVTAPFDLSRSAVVRTRDGIAVGMIGELRADVIRNFKLPEYSAAMTLDLDSLVMAYSTAKKRYAPLSKYPRVSQDISLIIPIDTKYSDVYDSACRVIARHVKESDWSLRPVSIYQAKDTDTKTITFRFVISSYEKTLAEKDVTKILDMVKKSV